MKPIAAILVGLVLCGAAFPEAPERPRITGIHHVRLYATNMDKSRAFYGQALGLPVSGVRCSPASESCFAVSFGGKQQHIELAQSLPAGHKNWLAEIVFSTDNIAQMRRYLVARDWPAGNILKEPNGTKHFELRDPDDHLIAFIEPSHLAAVDDPPPSHAAGERIVHAGLVVRNRAATEKFYQDVLGFRPYWHGGMKDDQTDWVSLQVPDGTDWVEFMVNVPLNADQHTLGVMNHIALGVPDIHVAAKQLLTNGMKPSEEPKMGRDGKWQLNLYDPDQTRVELMEFTPVEKPCCSEYTGPHPKP
jgi:catechol 2,3-dioxygenase-like lactoylglutathione lyase family enzyme